MKMTIVSDTDDPRGIRDTYKIVGHFHKRVDDDGYSSGREVKYGKIGFIKVLRAFARHCKTAEERGEDSTGLRFSKLFADEIFIEKYEL